MFDEAMIKEIEELAGCFFSEEEIMEILEIREFNIEAKKAFRKGSLQAEAELRKSIMELAKAGSSPAQNIAIKLLESFKRKSY